MLRSLLLLKKIEVRIFHSQAKVSHLQNSHLYNTNFNNDRIVDYSVVLKYRVKTTKHTREVMAC